MLLSFLLGYVNMIFNILLEYKIECKYKNWKNLVFLIIFEVYGNEVIIFW